MFKAKDAVRVFSNLRITPNGHAQSRTTGRTASSFTAYHAEEDLDATIERLLEKRPAQPPPQQKKTVALYFDEFQEVTKIDPVAAGAQRARCSRSNRRRARLRRVQ